MKKNIIAILLLASTPFLMQSCASGNSQEDNSEKDVTLKPLVKIEPVKIAPFKHEIKVQGNVETDEDILLSAEMGGLITAVNVKEGQTVQKGQVIAQVDASIMNSNMQELQTQLQYAEYMLEKQVELQKRGVGSEFDLETAKNQVNSLKASMNSLNTQRGKATIRAPFSGVIDQVFASRGQMAGPSSPIVRLVNNTKVDIVSTISEKHFYKIKVGTPIRVTFPNYSDTVVDLKITNVGNYIEPTNRTFRIMSTINKNTEFLPNMLAEVSITDMEVDSGLVIPSNSVLKDQESKDFVYVASKFKGGEKNQYQVKKMTVVVIEKYDGTTLISPDSEIKAGDSIIVEGARGVANGDIVRIK